METRVCVCCGEVKPISGVWYLMADQPGAFMCGGCFTEDASQQALAARS